MIRRGGTILMNGVVRKNRTILKSGATRGVCTARGGCKMAFKQKKIIAVSGDRAALTAINNVLDNLCDMYAVPSAAIMLELLAQFKPDLVLLDIESPGINGYETAKMLRKSSAYNDIAIVFTSVFASSKTGTEDNILNPFLAPNLLRRSVKHLTQAGNRNELRKLNDSMSYTPGALPLEDGVIAFSLV